MIDLTYIIDYLQSWAIFILGIVIILELERINRKLKKVKQIALGG